MSVVEKKTAATFVFAATFVAGALVARPAHAVDPWEIQVYDGTANPAGAPGLEVHMNTVADGRKEAEPPELPSHHQSHLTLEPSFGVTSWWELGAYLQSALEPDGRFDYAGTKLRSKFVTPPSFHEHLRLGVNFELAALPSRFDPDRYGVEMRPIVAWEDAHWLLAANPNLETALAGSGLTDGPAFEPGLMAVWKVRELVGFGFEYYAGFGPLAHPLPLRDQEHYLYEVFHLLSEENIELTGGVGEGLTHGSNALTFKVIVGYTFDLGGKGQASQGAGAPSCACPPRR